MKNIIMDEAVRISEQRMNELRNEPITSLASSTTLTQITIVTRYQEYIYYIYCELDC